jgi:hypothetical protein
MLLRALACIGLIAVAGCTTSLKTAPDTLRSKQNQALPGISYALPMLQYDVKVVYKLQRCPGDWDSNKDLAIGVETAVTNSYVAGERYLVDYRALTNDLKITNFTIETYADTGTLKGVNSSAEDKTGDVLKSVTELGISAASIATGSPFAAAQSDDLIEKRANAFIKANLSDVTDVVCTADTLKALTARKDAIDRIKTITTELAGKAKQAEQISIRASLKLPKEKDAETLASLHDDYLTLSKELADKQALVDDTDKKFSLEDHWLWPKTYDAAPGQQPLTARATDWAAKLLEAEVAKDKKPHRDTLEKALAGFTVKTGEDGLVKARIAQTIQTLPPTCIVLVVGECLTPHMGVYASLETGRAEVAPCAKTTAAPGSIGYKTQFAACPIVEANIGSPAQGIFVREPIKAQLVLCGRGAPCYGSATKPLHEGSLLNAPQLGQLRFVQLTNKTFQNNALVVALNRDGTIEKLQYENKAAIAAAALASISSAASKADTYLAKSRDQRETEAKAAKTDARQAILDERTDIAYARTETAAIRNEAAALRTDDVAKVQAQIDIMTKQQALMKLIDPPDPVVAQTVQDENTRLKAELERLTTQVAIKDAITKLSK